MDEFAGGESPRDDGAPLLVEAIWRYKWLVAAVTIFVIALSAGVGLLLSKKAVATATVGLITPSSRNVLAPGAANSAASLMSYASQRALYVTSDDVLGDAAGQLGPPTTVHDLQQVVTATASATSTSMVIQASAPTAARAVQIVDAVVGSYREKTAAEVEGRTTTALDTIQVGIDRLSRLLASKPLPSVAASASTTLSGLTTEASQIQTDSAVFGDGVEFIQAASTAAVPAHKLPLREMAVGALVGLAVGCTLAWLLADRRRRLSTPEQAERSFGAPLLGEIADLRHPVRSERDRARIFRSSRDVMAAMLSAPAPRVVLVTSPRRGVGGTTTAVGLAVAAAAEGLRVLAVDGDPTTKGLTLGVGLPANTPGLLEATSASPAFAEDLLESIEFDSVHKLTVLAGGALPEGDSAVTTGALRSLLDRLRSQFDLIVVDAPVPGEEYVASALAGLVDGVVLVVRRNSDMAGLTKLNHVLELAKAHVLGYVYTFARVDR
jgi:polysaccharide biosynthesis transport protein